MSTPHGLEGRVAIIGGGIAGLMAALTLAPQPVVLISRADLGEESSSNWAQGGIAASLGPDDSADLHLADTLEAGAGLCDAAIAAGILKEAGEAIAELEGHGVRFDRQADGSYAFGREAAHSRWRVLHAGGDVSGAAITQALVAAVRHCPSIERLTGVEARRLLVRDGAVAGVLLQRSDRVEVLPTSRVIMATGGLGGLFNTTTNPSGNFGQGVMMAARAGAALADMEFVQFHPTALDVPRTPLALVSEAVRGEGAILVDAQGRRFMADIPGAELAPRDVVARAIHAEIARNGRVFLDARQALGDGFAKRFPGIDELCREAGIDPACVPIPVRPAAHYHMGGIATDARGRSSLGGLWAVGECAATGLHGANRLASNSLLEAVVMARRAAQDLAGQTAARVWPVSHVPYLLPQADPAPLRPVVSRTLGVIREENGLREAIRTLLPIAEGNGPGSDPAIVALSVAVFAELRRESRGAHFRTDFPEPMPGQTCRRMRLDDVRAAAQALGAHPLLRSA
ncbi:L-aspartate oxidase [Aliiruegeria sabulilitoris]|uniref:L-aspartate oxidase n=1 Tax=Aliiruegeria sabulilitoris TaxID=1510458 RepID=UPI000836014B|nr:L-aspartate oxidase [Aliiruegeria sabulilitoris]NDR58880.1 L-aspartate oxidase [Pseudoruegeria sp. M32A2M]